MTTFTPEQIDDLDAKLEPSKVKTREQSGRKLSYIEGWVAIAEANRIFGFDGWNRETVDIRCVAERQRKIGQAGREGWGVSYVARVRVTVGDIVREGVGAGHGIDVDLGLAHESAIKEAETDAMKRGLMTFGNPFGLALYDKTQANVGYDDEPAPPPKPVRVVTGKTIADLPPDGEPTESEKKTVALLKAGIDNAHTLPDLKDWWVEKQTQSLLNTLPPSMRHHVEHHKEQRKAELTAELRMAG